MPGNLVVSKHVLKALLLTWVGCIYWTCQCTVVALNKHGKRSNLGALKLQYLCWSTFFMSEGTELEVDQGEGLSNTYVALQYSVINE